MKTVIIYNRYSMDGTFLGERRYEPTSREDYERAMEVAERLPDEYEIVNVEHGFEWRTESK